MRNFKKKIFTFHKTQPNKEFIVRKLLPIYNIYELKDGIPITFNKSQAKDKIHDLIDEFTYKNPILKRIEDKSINPITVLRHHLQQFNYSVVVVDKLINHKHVRDYLLTDLSKSTCNLEIIKKAEGFILKFD
jgi:hypothetical protein